MKLGRSNSTPRYWPWLACLAVLILFHVSCSQPVVCYRVVEIDNGDDGYIHIYAQVDNIESLIQITSFEERSPTDLKIGDFVSLSGRIDTFAQVKGLEISYPINAKERAIAIIADGLVRCKHSL